MVAGGWCRLGGQGRPGERTFTLIPEWPATHRSDAGGSGEGAAGERPPLGGNTWACLKN